MANRRGKVETVIYFILLGSKSTVEGDHHKIKRHLLLGRKAMTNLDSVFKSRVITFFFYLQYFLASRSSPMSQFFELGGQSIGVSASASVFLKNIQD